MKFLVIGDQDTVMGFSLAGVEGMVVNSKKEFEHFPFIRNHCIDCKVAVFFVKIIRLVANRITRTNEMAVGRKN